MRNFPMFLTILEAVLLAACSGQVATDPYDAKVVTPGADAALVPTDGSAVPGPDAAAAGLDASIPLPGADAAAPAGPDAAPSLVIERVGDTFEIPTIAGGKRHADVAHDPVHDVYLVVHGQGDGVLGGAFLSADGVPVGAPFTLCQGAYWTQGPRVTWFPAAGAFLVAWHDTRLEAGARATLWARLVAYENGGPKMLAADFQVSSEPSYQETLPGLGCADAAAECLLVWEKLGGSLLARRVGSAGVLGNELVLHDGDWNADPAVAFAPGGPSFLVTNTFALTGAEVWARRIELGTGNVVGAPTLLGSAAGTWITQAQWEPAGQRYLVGWWQGALMGRFVQPDGTASGDGFPLVPGYGYNDGFALSYSAPAGVFAAAMHGNTYEDWVALIGPDGRGGTAIEGTLSPADCTGNFNPRLAAHPTRREWMLVSVRSFKSVVGQRLRAR